MAVVDHARRIGVGPKSGTKVVLYPDLYPHVLSERATLEMALAGRSISRLGDGELRLITGNGITSQIASKKLAAEMQAILTGPTKALVCIGNLNSDHPVRWFWDRYLEDRYIKLLNRDRVYGSTWVTRPDCAPWINNWEYFSDVEGLWRNQDIVFVHGDDRSLRETDLAAAKSIRHVVGKGRHDYEHIDELMERVGTPSGPVILCIGATATCMAERLAQKGVHALDLGHLGMFIRRHRRNMEATDFASADYAKQLKQLHSITRWGTAGVHHAKEIEAFAAKVSAASVLDYGCGKATLGPALQELNNGIEVFDYDPGIIGKDALPAPADIVVATDVLEHIERDRLKNVLDHIHQLSRKGVFLIIAMKPAKETLPDGRNAHLIIENETWWTDKLTKAGMKPTKVERRKGLFVWIEK